MQRQPPIGVWFRNGRVGEFRADLPVGGRVIVEIEAFSALRPDTKPSRSIT